MRIAITGGIAEGKSTVLSMLANLGFATESADRVARTIFLQADVQALLAPLAGLDAPPVTPEALRAAIARDPEIRRTVNAITHPRIREAMDRSPADFHEVPLLIEACLFGRYDECWVVTCGAAEQRRRLEKRLGDFASAEALIQTQLPTRVKIAFADEVIDTSVSVDFVAEKLKALAERVRS